MKGEWSVWRNAFSKEECESIIKRSVNFPESDGVIGVDTDDTDVNSKYRRSKVRFVHDDIYPDLFKKMWDMTIQVNREWFNFHIEDLRFMQYTEYDESYKGEYKRHHDVFWTENPHRKLSVVLQLTDPSTYEGGDLGLDVEGEPPSDYKDQGTVIWFPSWTPHWVTPVTKGKRNSIVCWFEGPHWR